MACTYCFYLQKAELFKSSKTHRMTNEVLEEMVRQVMTFSGSEISFGWQGGEPTLMGLDFFKKAVEFQKRFGRNQTVGNGLQTNGILIDRKWADFFKEYRFLIGLSLDGPEHIHDRYRRLRNRKKSWKKVTDRAKLLLDAGVEVNALSVVNDYSVRFPEEIYAFHKSLGLNYMQFIPCVETEPDDPTVLTSFSVPANAFGRFLVTLFDLWMDDFKDDKPTTSLRYFESVFYTYVGMPPPMCTLTQECGIYMVVEHNGDVYACDFFVEPKWKLGNIMEDRLPDMLNSTRQNTFGKQKGKRPDECQACRWLPRCWGGCTKDRLFTSQGIFKNHLCEAYQMFFEHADSKYRDLAERWKNRQTIIESDTYNKIQRNDPCPCGSGKKFKLCCGR